MAVVEKAIRRHPKSENYRAAIKKNQILVYERQGPDVDRILEIFTKFTLIPPGELRRQVKEKLIEGAQYSPIMRFNLKDPRERTFEVERWCFLGKIEDWIDIWQPGKLDDLVKKLIPKLGTDAFFDLY